MRSRGGGLRRSDRQASSRRKVLHRFRDHHCSANVQIPRSAKPVQANQDSLRRLVKAAQAAQREQMLIDERIKIEQIYKERDAQLRNVLHVVATKFLSHANADAVVEEAINADVIEASEGEWISLKAFMKLKRLKEKEKKKIKNRFESLGERDQRLSVRDGKIFLNPSVHDYSALL